ncbi:Vacuolar protein sorting-associated protein 26A [Termitomyces sp. J132]|nr:Vacuolar protein sorting-associated protein 26A [Termitomyces sp. J132]
MKDMACQRLMQSFTHAVNEFLDEQPDQTVTIQWCPGHKDIKGNERADKVAKEGAQKWQTNRMLHSLIPSKDVPSVFPSPVVWLSTQYNKSQYHLKDVTVGQFYFLLVQKFEIMNGDPVCGETIPIHLLLGGFDLTPTFRDVNKKFSTEYYRNLVLIDEEDRRYFKQQISPADQVILVKISAENTLAIQVNLYSSSDSRIGQEKLGQKRRWIRS